MSARNARQLCQNCLIGFLQTFRPLNLANEIEYILIDDNSDTEPGVVDLFLDFRARAQSPVSIFRFRQRRYYAWGCAYGFAKAKGDWVLFISHDMIVTPDYIRGVLNVAGLDESFGIVRGTSEYVDCFPQYQFIPPLPVRGLEDVMRFAAYVADYHGLSHAEDQLLTGDAMLIRRSVFDKIGSFDTRFPFGYFSDIDFGLRAQRAGFKMVCAKGAWLHHEGAGAYKNEAAVKQVTMQTIHAHRMEMVQQCYESFRKKWDESMPPRYPGAQQIDFAGLRQKAVGFELRQAFVPLEDPLVEVL
jgi:GT2 family glycosyltransferase